MRNRRPLADSTGEIFPGREAVIPNARHGTPRENAAAFNQEVLGFF
jgi:pimeloyl-ACP methyl ester carboxylesterase